MHRTLRNKIAESHTVLQRLDTGVTAERRRWAAYRRAWTALPFTGRTARRPAPASREALNNPARIRRSPCGMTRRGSGEPGLVAPDGRARWSGQAAPRSSVFPVETRSVQGNSAL